MRRILILRGGALGDFIVTLPALAALRAAFPTAQIELAGNAPAAALAVNRGLLDTAHSQHESRWSALYDSAPLPSALATWLARFDLVLNFWPDPDVTLAAHFPLHSAQRFLTAPAHPTIAPAAAHYCAPLQNLGIAVTDFFYPLTFHIRENPCPSVVKNSAAKPDTPAAFALALHPGSGSSSKNWPAENYLALLPQFPAPLLLILGEAELDHWSALLATPLQPGLTTHRIGSLTLTLAICLPLEDVVALLARCTRYLGHDTGISHLAAACSVPSLLLFGPTDPTIWAPPATHVHILRAPVSLKELSLSAVQAALTSTPLAQK